MQDAAYTSAAYTSAAAHVCRVVSCVAHAPAKPRPGMTSALPYALQDAVRRVSRKLGTMEVLK